MTTRIKFVIRVAACFALWLLSAYILLALLSVERHLEHADAIVVLAGSADYKKRTDAAADLWKEGIAPKVIVTNDGELAGWENAFQRNPSFAELAVRNLLDNGVNAESIEVPPVLVHSTRDEGESVSRLASERNYGSITLVTSAFHTRRSLWIFERVAEQKHQQITYGIEFPKEDRSSFYRLYWWIYPSNWLNIPLEISKLFYYMNAY